MGNSQSISRRDFLKLMAAACTVITFAPFVDWDKILANCLDRCGSKSES